MTTSIHIEPVISATGVQRSAQELQNLLDAARTAHAKQDFERAELFARLAMLIYPETAAARIALADLLEAAGRGNEAIPELRRALELDKDSEPARWKLALLQSRAGSDPAEPGPPPTVCYQLARELEKRGRRLDAARPASFRHGRHRCCHFRARPRDLCRHGPGDCAELVSRMTQELSVRS